MPLTGAEKTRRYREKLKQERPEEYKAQCKRNLERIKSKKNKISEMTPDEAEEQRKKWRKAKQRSKKEKKKKQNESESQNVIKMDNVKFKKKYKLLLKKYNNLALQAQNIKSLKETYKKRYQRLKQQTTKKIKDLENQIIKQKSKKEVLELTLKKTYKTAKTHPDKTILRKLMTNTVNKTYMRNMVGLKRKERMRRVKRMRTEIEEISNYFLRDDVSRNTAGKTQVKTRNKTQKQIRFLTDNLCNLYKKYRSEGGRYGFTTFFKHKPFYVLTPYLNSRDTCLCIRHSNVEFQHASLKKHVLLKIGLQEILNQISCDIKNYSCMYSNCEHCKDRKPPYCIENDGVDDNAVNVSWLRWERRDHLYTIKEGFETKEIKTKKTEKVIKTGSLAKLKNDFEQDLKDFKRHYFNMQHQHSQYRMVVSNLQVNEVVIVVDFSENYEAKLGEEIQAMQFGASKNQISLHTGMVYWADRTQSFCTISEQNNHQPPAIWAHMAPILDLIQKESPNISVVHFFSNGLSSQYRQKTNFFLLAHFTKALGFNYATWSYFESGHGKNVADGIGGRVKRTLDRKVCQGMDVADAKDAYEILTHSLKTIKVFLIQESSISDISKIFSSNVQALKGTLRVHQIITTNENAIKFRDVSCFCGPYPGQCDCFSPQIHHLVPYQIQTRPQAKIKRKKISFLFPEKPIPSTSKDNLGLESSSQNFKMQYIHNGPPSKKPEIVSMPILPRNDLEKRIIPNDESIIIIYLEDDLQNIESFSTSELQSLDNALIGLDDHGDTLPVTLCSHDESIDVDVPQSVSELIEHVKSSSLNEKKAKKTDLVNLCRTDIIPVELHSWFQSLPVCKHPDQSDRLPEPDREESEDEK